MQEKPETMAADQAGSATSAFTAPQISLPKGGGAIRGIDEKFTANPATGTGSLTVAIAVSPGRSGFGPQLSLNYDSGNGNGPFGIGWRLSLPSITRKTDKGLPQYRDHEESDVFILSGAEDLVPVLKRDQNGKWTFDEFERDGFRVKQYRPRVEGLFARIERWTSLQNGEVHWRSISKDNILTVYGIDAGTRIADPEDPEHVFSWLICQSFDDKGNAIVYDYVAENDKGVDLRRPNERNRIRSANRYLKRVRYGNRVPLLLDADRPSFRKSHIEPLEIETAGWMFEAIFDYGESHYRAEPADRDGHVFSTASIEDKLDWPIRKDPFSSYRSGFEVRTYRICHRTLMFHHFPDELGSDSYLIRSTAFEYNQNPIGSFLARVVQSGHRRLDDGRYLTRSLPPLDLTYTPSPLEEPAHHEFRVHELDSPETANLPGGVDGTNYRWIDLDGEGIAGVLTQQADSWFYKPNLGGGHLGAVETTRTRPSMAALSDRRQQFLDVAGDGNLDLVELSHPMPGFYERTLDAGWTGFRPFRSLPVRDWQDPNLRFVDVTGGGIADVLITEENALTWHPSLLKAGFGPGVRVRVPFEEERGPRVLFADSTQSIYLADMSGDGLSDIVRIRNGEVCYWPNRGYGHFGPKVTMDNAPWFEEPDLFDQRRVRLADTDGSGTSDILYLGRDGVQAFLNESGNGWSSVGHLQFPPTDNLASISVADFLGRGTACLRWSSPLPRNTPHQLRYVDLMCGKKPHLLERIANNLGAETRIEYAPSTEFYLADKAAGTPWVTRLPFPVHVVKRVETYDYVSRNRFVTLYSYHHGYYDGVEREFRGFGRVDQLDTEELSALTASGNFPAGSNADTAYNVPPVLTKTWFHTGVYLEGGLISRHMAHEYYQEGSRHGEGSVSREQRQAMLLDDTILPENLAPEEAREGCRALKGSMLRQEVYVLDRTDKSSRPYTVSESNYTIRLLQPRRANRHCVFFSHAREAVSFNYERTVYRVNGDERADPRVTHNVTLEVDAYGNVLKSVAIGYGRRFPDPSPILTEADRAKQAQILLTLADNRYTNAVLEADAYRIPLPCESCTYELIKLQAAADLSCVTNLFRFHELTEKVARASDGNHNLPFEDWQALGALHDTPYRRLLKRSRSYYRSDRLDRELPLGVIEALALPGQNFNLAFTPGLLTEVYQRRPQSLPPENLIPDRPAILGEQGGYVDLEGDAHWWVPSGRVYYSPGESDSTTAELHYALQYFFLPHRFRDPFGNVATVRYDNHGLTPVETRDPVGNTVRAEIDYRVLSPRLITDPNGNRGEFTFDALGLVSGTALKGNTNEHLGDSLEGFATDLTPQQQAAFLSDPTSNAAKILGNATSRIVYDVERYFVSQKPVVAVAVVRETHVSDLGPGQISRIQVSFSYSDGFQREIQQKLWAESGPVTDGGPDITPRWLGSGWTIFNNKGEPVRQYEPFFSARYDFEFAAIIGVSPILFYDPVERVVATVHPNHTYEKVVFDPWTQQKWDVNDTVLVSDPAQDADVGVFFQQILPTDYLPSWYTQRIDLPANNHEQNAAIKAAAHADTPAVSYFDTLGRTFMTLVDNGVDQTGQPQKYPTRFELDIEGYQRSIIDALGRKIITYDYDFHGTKLHSNSVDAGERWMLDDTNDKLLLAWNSRGFRTRHIYDALRRPTALFFRYLNNSEVLAENLVYGEGQLNPEAVNLRGRMYQSYDAAGVVTNTAYDFKGNLLSSTRRLLRGYKNQVDWSQSSKHDLADETFVTSTTYDALNRPVTMTTPDGSILRPEYNRTKLLRKIAGNLHISADSISFVTNINYDAKGQRLQIDYGNGASTKYKYDPATFRLMHLATTRPGFPANEQAVQDLKYTYDPAGNITHIKDDAQDTIFFRNKRVEPSNDYTYEAIYRLIKASGREHLGQTGAGALLPPVPTSYNDVPRIKLLHPNDGRAMGTYEEQYQYDAVGNFLQYNHKGSDPASPGWTRSYTYAEASPLEPGKVSNRLTRTTISGAQPYDEVYAYDVDGNMTHMPQLQVMQWDFKDQLLMTQRQAVNADDADGTQHQGERTYYIYDSAGQRVRKATERQNGTLMKERIYLGGFEVYRECDGCGSAITLERESLHVMDDKQRVALAETRTQGKDGTSGQLIRYQFSNHLRSASLELDHTSQIISYEEYYSYGSTSYQAGRSSAEVSLKRYRYTGMERDEESGLEYHSARYYLPWLCRWSTVDPSGTEVGNNLYIYCSGNPVIRLDCLGKDDWCFTPGCGDFSPWEFAKEEVAPRVVGGLKAGAGFAGMVGGELLCDTLVGCVIGGPLFVASADYGGSGLSQIWHRDPQPTALGSVAGPTAQALEEDFVNAASLALMLAQGVLMIKAPTIMEQKARAAAPRMPAAKTSESSTEERGPTTKAASSEKVPHVGASPDSVLKRKAWAGVADAGREKCVANVCAVIKNRQLKVSDYTATEIEKEFNMNLGRPSSGPNPLVATPEKAIGTIEKITGLEASRVPVNFRDARGIGQYVIFFNRQHVVEARILTGGRVSIVDPTRGAWGSWDSFLEYANQHALIYGSNPGSNNLAYRLTPPTK